MTDTSGATPGRAKTRVRDQPVPAPADSAERAAHAPAPPRKAPNLLGRARGHALAKAVDLGVLRRAYEAGESIVDLALAHGVSRTTIRKLLRGTGCPLRTHARACQVREQHNYLRRPPPEPVSHRAPVRDVFGMAWRVTHADATEHGFDLLRGVRVGGRGSPAVILTGELTEHLERHRLAPRLLALPLGDSAIGRLRRRLDQDWTRENRAWWEERRDDLDRLSPAQFAARHEVQEGTATAMRRRLCGPRRVAWLDEAARALLLSDRPCREVAAAVGKSPAYITEVRAKLRRTAMQKS